MTESHKQKSTIMTESHNQELIIMTESHKQQLQFAEQTLNKQKELHTETNQKLAAALKELESLQLANKELSHYKNGENLDEFFVYKVLDGAKAEDNEDVKTTRQR